MKKFKNLIAVEGPESLRKAFAEELKLLGYEEAYNLSERQNDWKEYPILGIQYSEGKNNIGNFAKHFISFSKYKLYTLPAQWNEALAAASELEEEIPEYVECTSGSKYSHYTGKIYKIEDGKISCEATGTPTPWRGFNSCGFIFKPSTKEAYEAQQNKELLEKLIKESGFKAGDEVIDKHLPNSVWDETQLNWRTGQADGVRNIEEFKLKNGQLLVQISLTQKDTWFKSITLEKASQFKILTLGDKNIEVKISKDKIEAEGRELPYCYITHLADVMKNKKDLDGRFNWSIYCSWEITFPSVKIGCTTFTLEELEKVVETYNELNK